MNLDWISFIWAACLIFSLLMAMRDSRAWVPIHESLQYTLLARASLLQPDTTQRRGNSSPLLLLLPELSYTPIETNKKKLTTKFKKIKHLHI